jgi:hypothetical protein
MNRRNFLASALAIVGGLPFIKAQILTPPKIEPDFYPCGHWSRGKIVDVRDFGAHCDGVTDDTAAIQAAIDHAAAIAGVLVMRDCDVFISGTVHIRGRAELTNNVFRNTPYSFDGPTLEHESAA